MARTTKLNLPKGIANAMGIYQVAKYCPAVSKAQTYGRGRPLHSVSFCLFFYLINKSTIFRWPLAGCARRLSSEHFLFSPCARRSRSQ